MSTAHNVAELPEITGGWETRTIEIADRVFQLTVPAAPDAFLDEPQVLAAHARDGYMPYWAYLWPAAADLAAEILRGDRRPSGSLLEIGAGIGLPGLAALAAGDSVTFSDHEPMAVTLALHNARQNGFGSAKGLVLDFRRPQADRFPIIAACDIVYERRNHEPILNLLNAMLDDGGVFLLADPGRQHCGAFLELAERRGWQIARRELPPEQFPGRTRVTTQLCEMKR